MTIYLPRTVVTVYKTETQEPTFDLVIYGAHPTDFYKDFGARERIIRILERRGFDTAKYNVPSYGVNYPPEIKV